jgi:spoIIIJ-associated protein
MSQTEVQKHLETIIAKILEMLGIDAVITIEPVTGEERNYFSVKLEVESGGPELIGRYGSMLESLATVVNAMLGTVEGEEPWRVILDVNNYRQERTEYIEDLTLKAIAQVVEHNQPVELSPMKAWERRVVHMVVSKKVKEYPKLKTESDGEGIERHVTIAFAS